MKHQNVTLKEKKKLSSKILMVSEVESNEEEHNNKLKDMCIFDSGSTSHMKNDPYILYGFPVEILKSGGPGDGSDSPGHGFGGAMDASGSSGDDSGPGEGSGGLRGGGGGALNGVLEADDDGRR